MPRKSAAVTVAAKRTVRAKAAPAKTVKAPARAARAAVAKTAKPAAKTAAKTGVKTAVRVAAKALARPSPTRAARKAPASSAQPATVARPVLVRDSFTMPEHEYAVLADVKSACLRAGIDVKKSELLRVGVALLGQVDIATLRAVLAALPQLKTGRPPAGT
ncbi:hypothetical protein [Telluria aromaticivorans]|uniref:Uncharacterized protein n=1 Tax=Telluria aromaticivorans TaxID=2725995 RepID=A0A7Y2JYN1_9BURK|nr:hypothetical protein [Telluria aromaticivorans]NNG23446.1 hypothetical protein [Telluria aromaticivorans]